MTDLIPGMTRVISELLVMLTGIAHADADRTVAVLLRALADGRDVAAELEEGPARG